ncbi:hypothetical protein BGX38DRAFT_194181 [Terfezia claveryi]|nr:hypothetical protein BGX38DRAFT_194181 [Terfezia claveryi]
MYKSAGGNGLPQPPVELSKPAGVLVSAERGQGATERSDPTSIDPAKPIHRILFPAQSRARSAIVYESRHSRRDKQANSATKLGITKPSVRIDFQAKYGSIAREMGIFTRGCRLVVPMRKRFG